MSNISFENISKIYPNAPRPAVDDVSFDVTSGEFVVLLGPSGCGKTTLMKMVNRLIEPTSGRITIDGDDIRASNVTALRQRIGYVIQQIGLFPHMTVGENVAVVPRLLKWDNAKTSARIDELLTLIELEPSEFRARYPAQLSGGQQQRVGLARALAADPGILLMDEPFGAIDAITRTSLQDEMRRLQQHLHKTILFVTHDVEEALRLADKIAILEKGKLIQYDAPFAILQNPANAFVAQLIGADDMVRQLSVISADRLMQPLTTAPDNLRSAPTITSMTTLREALSLMLGSGSDVVQIQQDGTAIGWIGLDQIRRHSAGNHA